MSQGFVNCKSPYRVNVSESTSTLQVPVPKVKAYRPRSQTGMEVVGRGGAGVAGEEGKAGLGSRKRDKQEERS